MASIALGLSSIHGSQPAVAAAEAPSSGSLAVYANIVKSSGASSATASPGQWQQPVSAPKSLLLHADVFGAGTFGVVFKAQIEDTREVVAVKRVLQDGRFKSRELQITARMQVGHPNIVELKNYFFQHGTSTGEIFLNLVLGHMPMSLHTLITETASLTPAPARSATPMSMLDIKLYAYQLCRGLACMHTAGVTHRDIKPQNLLVDPRCRVLKVCDFGSAKPLVSGEPSVPYICSRFYRAPELALGATHYSEAIDMWSAGCVIAELVLGHPIFRGSNSADVLAEICALLGTPTAAHKAAMQTPPASSAPLALPRRAFAPASMAGVFRARAPPSEFVDLVQQLLQYDPGRRPPALLACTHPFFDELRGPGLALDGLDAPPQLFNFSSDEIVGPGAMSLRAALVPVHARTHANYFDHVHAGAKRAHGGGGGVSALSVPVTPFPDVPVGGDDSEILATAIRAGGILPAGAVRFPLSR